MPGVANQSETNNHISDCVTAKSHMIHMGTQEHHPISSSLKHVPLHSCVYCKYHTPIWKGQNFTSHLLLCMLLSETSDDYVRAAWNRAKNTCGSRAECHTAVRGPDILRNTIVRDVLHSTKSMSFLLIHYFLIIDKIASRAGWNGFAGRSLETPAR